MTQSEMSNDRGSKNPAASSVVNRAFVRWPLAVIAAIVLAAGPASATETAPPGGSSAIARFAQLPLSFEVNQGQADEGVQYIARGHQHTIYLEPTGATIALHQSAPSTNDLRTSRLKVASEVRTRLIRMTLPGARPDPAATGLEPGRGRVNYLIGNDPGQWQQGVATFTKVQYREVHPGVDLVYYGNQQHLEFDFVVAPGANPSLIALHFDGADRIEIDREGSLVLHVGESQLRQHRPVSYQIIDGKRREVESRYRLKDSRTVTFAMGDYDRSQTLVIDPILSYSTFFGGSKGDIGWAIAVDSLGSAYIAGDTLSSLKKLDASAVKAEKSKNDAFVARIDLDTNLNVTLGYVTYLGGKGFDGAVGIAVDASGQAYVTGYTTSTNFPAFGSSGIVQTNIGGTNIAKFNTYFTDAFVTKLDTNGAGVYSTYLGGEFNDAGSDIAVDATGRAYVGGYTDSMRIYLVTNRTETIVCTNSICGATITKTNTQYVKLELDPYTTTNTVVKVTKTAANIIDTIVTTTRIGTLISTNLPVGFPVVNGVQTNNGGFINVLDPDLYGADMNNFTADLFVSRLSPDGATLEFSTYLGGVSDDFGTGVAVDPAGNFVVSGYSLSFNFPVTNAFQAGLGGTQDAVAARFDAAGSLIYSTFIGGSQRETGYRVAVDASGAAYLAGATASSDFPRTPGALNRGGVFVNSGGGTNAWTNSSSGLTHSQVRTLVADPFSPGTYYAGTLRGVFKSTDGTANWTAVNTGLTSRTVNSLAADPFNANRIYAGTAGGVFSSTDAGLTWTNQNAGLDTVDVRVLLFNPVTSNLYAGTARGVYHWPLGATNWTILGSGVHTRQITALALNPASVSNLYAGTTVGIFKSTNAGANWKSGNSGLATTSVHSLAIAPDDPSVLYAGTTRGLFKSTNAAARWFIRTNGLDRPQLDSLLIDPGAPLTLYAGSTVGLFKSLDGGDNWFRIQTNLTTVSVAALAFDPASTATVLAGTTGGGFAGGTNDAFLVKLAPDGLSLPYSLTIGGSRNDEAWDVAVDAAGFATIVGQTASQDLPVAGVTTNDPPQQAKLSGKIDAFVSKLDPTGATNIFTMYFGGKKSDFGHSVALDPDGNAYIVGRTESSSLPITTNRLETVEGNLVKFGGGRDAFVAKLMTGSLVVTPLLVGDQVILTWPASSPEFILESRSLGSERWTPIAQRPVVIDGRNTVILPAATAGQFFRLRTPETSR